LCSGPFLRVRCAALRWLALELGNVDAFDGGAGEGEPERFAKVEGI
jgi:hypothetical protein